MTTTPPQAADKDLSDYVLTVQLADECGVTTPAVRRWLHRRKQLRRPFYIVPEYRSYVRLDLAHEYASRSTSESTKSLKTVKGVLAEVPGNGYRLLHRLEAEGKITVVRKSNKLYVSKEDAAYVQQAYRSSVPLPGWVRLQEAAQRAGVTPWALTKWAERNIVELRFYRHPVSKHLVHYLEAKHADRYVAKADPRRPYQLLGGA